MANDKILEELANKLNNHGSEVNSQMWSAIQSQIGTAAATGTGAASGAFGIGKIAAIVVGVTSITVASYFALNSDKEDTTKANTEQENAQKTSINEALTEERLIAKPETSINNLSTKTESSKEQATLSGTSALVIVPEETMSTANKVEPIELITPVAPEPIRTIADNRVKNSNPAVKKEAQVVVEKHEPTPVVDKAIEQVKKAEAYSIKKLPNIFTPNGDGVNDYFEIESEGLQNYSLVVLDMSNKVVWQTKDPNAKWDGLDLEGNKVSKGQYVYFLAAQDANGNAVGKHERLTVQF